MLDQPVRQEEEERQAAAGPNDSKAGDDQLRRSAVAKKEEALPQAPQRDDCRDEKSGEAERSAPPAPPGGMAGTWSSDVCIVNARRGDHFLSHEAGRVG